MERPRWFALALSAALVVGTSTSAVAQHSGNGYLFHAPDGTITIRGGYSSASAGSDIFDFATENLTLNKSDFSGFNVGAEVAFAVTSRLQLTVDGSYIRSSKGSEFRNFLDNHDLPIEQTTSFERIPLTINAKYFLTSPGRSVGTLAWIPEKIAPYVGIGGGSMWYRFRQKGDFVDFNNMNVFPSTFDSSDWTLVGQAMAGAVYTVTPTVALTADARYLKSRAALGNDFGGFNRIDLSGVSASIGLTFRL